MEIREGGLRDPQTIALLQVHASGMLANSPAGSCHFLDLSGLERDDVSARGLAPYASLRRRAFAGKHRLAWLLQVFVHQPALLEHAVRRLAERADLGPPLVGALGDFRAPRDVLRAGYLWRLLGP